MLVLGLGTKGGGVEVTRWLVAQGADVTVTDQKSADALRVSIDGLRGLPVRFVLGRHDAADVTNAELIIRNPAVPPESPLLALARDKGITVVMDTTLFFQYCPAPIAGITGTRGKSTTTAVSAEILRLSRPDTVLAGNIGRSPLADLERIRVDTPVVLELSSWQLEGLMNIRRSPHWAVLTTILQDHLNRYPSVEAYAASKETIVAFQLPRDIAILPVDSPWGERFAQRTPAERRWFGVLSTRDKVPRGNPGDKPQGVFRVGDNVVLRRGEVEELLLLWSELSGAGDHTKRNLLAGALLALEMGSSLADVRAVLRSFQGLPNRLEVVAERAGRTFVNDTTATTPEAVVAALTAFPGRPVILIAGGTDKNLDYAGLFDALRTTTAVHGVVLLDGSATEKLLRASTAPAPVLTAAPRVRQMQEAVIYAWKHSRPGDVILLSPGAASFELFRDEFDRGQQFREAVTKLAGTA